MLTGAPSPRDETKLQPGPRTADSGREHAASVSRHAIALGPGAPAAAREALAQVEGLAESTLHHHAQMLVSELISHRLRGSRDGGPRLVILDISVSGECLRVQLGEGNADGALAAPRRGGPALAWDIQLVAQLADHWGVRNDDVSVVWFELDT